MTELTLLDCYNAENKISFAFSKPTSGEKIMLVINGKHAYNISPSMINEDMVTVNMIFDSSNGRLSNDKGIVYAYVTDGLLADFFMVLQRLYVILILNAQIL